MTLTLAMFPLELVVFPGESLPLHIFENRYQQLIADCESEQISFGIPAYFNRTLKYGTEVKLEAVKKRYPTGASDVVCKGIRVFKITEFYPNYSEKLYAGAAVTFLENINDALPGQPGAFYNLVKRFYEVLGAVVPAVELQAITSYSFAHKLGLSLEQELHLLKMTRESDRYSFLIDHLTATIPIVEQVNRTRRLIELNGHFKNFDPLDFTEYRLGDSWE
ncbi:LON peptidase substrate-binding domain-containing protein [Leeuwenhoekiella sp. H156]|uniref:LON peptidase substrate-binding domain-containing protein n=1 Tax=Leeuwenhoekiella sp. H156 TaxID=3450128 RepID=UPI003FA49B48